MNTRGETSQRSSLHSTNASTMTGVEKISRETSVKIYVLTDTTVGHGSGTYFTYRGHYFVLTAYHVTEDKPVINGVKVGQKVLYTGYPNLTGPLTIYGTVSGFSVDDSIILQSYAWGGASGSAVLDYRGRLIGIVVGIEVVTSMTGLPSENENVILIKRFEEGLLKHVDFLLDN